jgi:hypothetical protein
MTLIEGACSVLATLLALWAMLRIIKKDGERK